MNLAVLDLNLLVALDALLREASVSRAAERIGLSQPATSHALRRLRELMDEGKTVSVGVSNLTLAQLEEFACVCPIAAYQPPYNMLLRDIEADTLPWCRRHNVACGYPAGDAAEVTIGTTTNAELQFDPTTASVPTGSQVTLTFENEDTVPHNLTFNDPIDAKTATVVQPDASEMLENVLGRLQRRNCRTIPVLERGTLIGLVTMDNVGEFLMIHAAERGLPHDTRGA